MTESSTESSTVRPRDLLIADLVESLKQLVAAQGECVCHVAYLSRGLRDPDCLFHSNDFEIRAAIRAIVRAESQ